MGLDSVELVVSYEEAFDITIPDDIAANLATVGLVHEFIVQATRSKIPAPDPEFIWNKIVEITAKQLRIKPTLITKNSYYVKDLGCD
jgi:acyl carrier protein